jgi:hypothetical protein
MPPKKTRAPRKPRGEVKSAESVPPQVETSDSACFELANAMLAKSRPAFPTVPLGQDSVSAFTEYKYDALSVKLARSVFKPGRMYRFRCTRTATLTASGAGVLLVSTGVNIGNFTEASALQALWDECRLKSTRIQYSMMLPTVGSGAGSFIPTSFFSAFDPSNNAGVAPSGTSLVSQIPGVKIWPGHATARQTNAFLVRGGRSWSLTTASATGTDPVGGIIGTWYHAITPATTASQIVAVYVLECDYEFRNAL